MNELNLEHLNTSLFHKQGGPQVWYRHTRKPRESIAKLSHICFVKKHSSSLTLLLFLLFTLTPCHSLSVTWVSCSIVKHTPHHPPPPLPTHLHTLAPPRLPQPQLPTPPVAFLGAHCTFKENMREA